MKKIIYSILVVCCLVNTASASSITKEETARWKNIGIYHSYIARWKKSNISLKEADKWIRLMKVSPNGVGAMYWKKAGIQTPEEALKWKQAGIHRREISMWKRAGLDIEEISKWRSANIGSVSFIGKMKKEGISPEEASEWIKVGINNDDKIIKMKQVGVSPQEVIEWKKAGVKARDIERWKKEGLTVEEVVQWQKIAVPIYNISALKKEGLSPIEVAKWKQAGVDIQIIHNVKAQGLTAEEVLEWKKSNVSLFNISEMKRAGLLPVEVLEWGKVGVSSSNIVSAKKAGLSIEEAVKWKRAGISSKSMFEWKKEGVALTDATKWMAIEINPFRMRKFKKIGIKSPEEAAKWRRARIFKLRDIDFLKSANVDPDEITKKGIEKNHKMISFLASYFDKSLWKEMFDKVSDKCQDNKCIVTSFTNTAKVRDDMLLVKIDGSSLLLEFPSQGFFSSSKVPDTFTLINNREKKFNSILKPSGTNEIELDGEEYKIETYEVIVAPVVIK
ncbi:hypothetical protein C9925_01135 [cyanobacterium G8-9]|nr:hypothetical protein C9925_01135 [cyanobacterium G8-9]